MGSAEYHRKKAKQRYLDKPFWFTIRDAKKRAENLLNLEALRVEMERKDLSAMEKKTLKQKVLMQK